MNEQIKMPAIPYMRIIKQYAVANGMRFWNQHDRKKAIAHYELFNAIKN
jgi:hypothetical protein